MYSTRATLDLYRERGGVKRVIATAFASGIRPKGSRQRVRSRSSWSTLRATRFAHNGDMPQLDQLTVEGDDARGFTVYRLVRVNSRQKQARLGYRLHPPSAGWNIRAKRHSGDVRLSDSARTLNDALQAFIGCTWFTLRNRLAFGLSLVEIDRGSLQQWRLRLLVAPACSQARRSAGSPRSTPGGWTCPPATLFGATVTTCSVSITAPTNLCTRLQQPGYVCVEM